MDQLIQWGRRTAWLKVMVFAVLTPFAFVSLAILTVFILDPKRQVIELGIYRFEYEAKEKPFKGARLPDTITKQD